MNDSFESWAWRNHLTRRLAELERQKLIERKGERHLDRVVRLTGAGRTLALGGRDPAARWDRVWDGQWRLILFDVPNEKTELRQQLRRTLRAHHFGCLQGSVWVSPDPAADLRALLIGMKVDAEAFLVVEGRPAAGESDGEIVAGAWNFAKLNECYEQCLALTKKTPPRDSRLEEWARRENAAWQGAVQRDPLLPRALLPAGYRGCEAFRARQHAFATLAEATGVPRDAAAPL